MWLSFWEFRSLLANMQKNFLRKMFYFSYPSELIQSKFFLIWLFSMVLILKENNSIV